jgi:hypothetical protein
MNYVDATLTGKRGMVVDVMHNHPRASAWLQNNVMQVTNGTGAMLKFLGTGAKSNDMVCF